MQSKLTFDAHQLASAASSTITDAIRSTLTIVASFGWLMWLNWRLTLMTFVVLPVVAVVIRYFSRRLRRIARDVQTRTGSMTHVLRGDDRRPPHRARSSAARTTSATRAVKAANSLRNVDDQAVVGERGELAADADARGAARSASSSGSRSAQSETGRLDLGDVRVAIVVALLTLLERLKALSGINAAIQRGLAAAESIFGLLDREEEPDTGTVVLAARARRARASTGCRCATPAPSARRWPTSR